jgi:hypothetical protein
VSGLSLLPFDQEYEYEGVPPFAFTVMVVVGLAQEIAPSTIVSAVSADVGCDILAMAVPVPAPLALTVTV